MQLHPINVSEFYMQKMSLKCWYYQFGFFYFVFIFWIVTRKLQLLHLRLKCRCYKTVLEYVCTYKFFRFQFLLFFKIRREKKDECVKHHRKETKYTPKRTYGKYFMFRNDMIAGIFRRNAKKNKVNAISPLVATAMFSSKWFVIISSV